MKEVLKVISPFHLVTTRDSGEVWAKDGDKLTVEERDSEHYHIRKLNSHPVYLTWKKKSWILGHCEKLKP